MCGFEKEEVSTFGRHFHSLDFFSQISRHLVLVTLQNQVGANATADDREEVL